MKWGEGLRKTEAMLRLSKTDLAVGRLLYPERIAWRPRCRADCEAVPRPCPYVGCRMNLYLEVRSTGAIVYNHPGEPWDSVDSCVLDVASEGRITLEEVGRIFNFTRERVRQIERTALDRIAKRARWARHILSDLDDEQVSPRAQASRRSGS